MECGQQDGLWVTERWFWKNLFVLHDFLMEFGVVHFVTLFTQWLCVCVCLTRDLGFPLSHKRHVKIV